MRGCCSVRSRDFQISGRELRAQTSTAGAIATPPYHTKSIRLEAFSQRQGAQTVVASVVHQSIICAVKSPLKAATAAEKTRQSQHESRSIHAMAVNAFLAKRDCVSQCVVPSCATIKCSANEMCVVSAQTCEACPKVSCAALSGGSTALAGKDKTGFPIGAIAGVVVIALLLALGLAWFIVRKRRVARCTAEMEEESSEMEKQSAKDATTYASQWLGGSQSRPRESSASLPICLGPVLREENKDTLFFVADDVYRMSYAESLAHTSPEKRTTSGVVDTSPAIIQSANQVTTQRVRPAMIQFRLGTSNPAHSPLVEERSGWEDDEADESPIERDLISRGATAPARESHTSPSRPSLRRTGSRILTGSRLQANEEARPPATA
ncbi:hypothetical protein BCR37DRAFT_383297 [Protomyces lactucae-debilis]|uniref:Membrane anchor Opy2 N-terminal domain-containing protein n=1 Tax=Protomyces lactucae-debilis TaxID=2754530 RepID=A0A1Y2EYG8_PROLT|nr:uncharacterized protein BCR37DRAFT_383297 [Protomyces lactucae-debilis]ORY76662.1 hypothetical protein BCR37DRAFT_383297 [Protomyces lactucae-debilis]